MGEELLLVVDENDNPLAPLPRKQVIEQGLWRRTSGIILLDMQKVRVLCQKRSELKDERPGVWIADFGGKSAPGEPPEQTILRELQEELGISLKNSDLNFYQKIKSNARRQFEYMYWAVWSGDISKLKYDPSEVAEIGWHDISEVLHLLQTSPNWYNYGFEADMFEIITAR